MRKITLVAIAAALVATGFAVWPATPTNARFTPSSQRIEPLQFMTNAKGLATAEFVDYTFVFLGRQ
jgi:hypothetical protein